MFEYWNLEEKEYKRKIKSKREYYQNKIAKFLAGDTDVICKFFQKHRFILGTLTPKEAQVFSMYFGLNGEIMTQRKIGEEFGVTGQYISLVLQSVYRKLRHPTRENMISYFDDEIIKFTGDYEQFQWNKLDTLLKSELARDFSERYKNNLSSQNSEIMQYIYASLGVPYNKIDGNVSTVLTVGEILTMSKEEVDKLDKNIIDKIYSLGLHFVSEYEYEQDWLTQCIFDVKNKNFKLRDIFKNATVEDLRYMDHGFKDIMEKSLEELDLSIRAFNALKRVSIDYMKDIVIRSEKDLYNVRNLGRMGREEVIARIRSYGLDIRPEDIAPDKWLEQLAIKFGMNLNTIKVINENEKQPTKEDVFNKLMEKSLEELDLSVRTFNCLKRSGVDCLKDIVVKSNEDILRVRNLGERIYLEIINKLETMGLKLRPVNVSAEDWINQLMIACSKTTQSSQPKVEYNQQEETMDLDINEIPEKYRKTYAIGADVVARKQLSRVFTTASSKLAQEPPKSKVEILTPLIKEQVIASQSNNPSVQQDNGKRLIAVRIDELEVETKQSKDDIILSEIENDISYIYDLEEWFINKYRSDLIKMVLAENKADLDLKFNLIEVINHSNKFSL